MAIMRGWAAGMSILMGLGLLSGCATTKKEVAMDPEAMHEAWMKAATPGPMHAYLAEGVGTWDGVVKHWMDPSMPPTVSNCVTTISPMMDGRFTIASVKGEIDFGGQKAPFEGFGLYGYDNVTKRFESTWVDNMGTCTSRGYGTLSDDRKTMTWIMTFSDPVTGKDMVMREVDRHTGPNSGVMEMYSAGPDGKEFKMMEITNTRRTKK